MDWIGESGEVTILPPKNWIQDVRKESRPPQEISRFREQYLGGLISQHTDRSIHARASRISVEVLIRLFFLPES